MKKRMGRPPKSGSISMTGRLEIRLAPGEKESYEQAAKADGMDRSEWMRFVLNEAVKRRLQKAKTKT